MHIAVVPAYRREVVCAVCKDPFQDARWRCEGCNTLLHLECRSALALCPSLGCGRAFVRPAPPRISVARRSGPGARHLLVALGVAAAALAMGLLGGTAVSALFPPDVRAERATPPAVQVDITAPIGPIDPVIPSPVPEVAPPPPTDLSHVRPGQEWVFSLEASGLQMEQSYLIEAVEPDRVRYRLRTRIRMPGATEMSDCGEPAPGVWEAPLGGPPVVYDSNARDTLTLAGRSWVCLPATSDGTTVWTPELDGRSTFPPYVRMESEFSRSELREIREPR